MRQLVRTKRKINSILEAIDVLFSDTSVPQRETLEALQEIQTDLDFRIGAIKFDIRKAGKEPKP